MNEIIDNFGCCHSSILHFDREGEFYLVLILKRRKDTKGRMMEGVNEDNRLIKHYFVYDKEYLTRKESAIKQLCKQNNARAYILPQRRSHDLVMWALHNKTSEILKAGAKNTHFDHLIRSCVAGMHEVPVDAKHYKRWVIDIDNDDGRTQNIARDWQQRNGTCPDWNGVQGLVNCLYGGLGRALVKERRESCEFEGSGFSDEAVEKFMPDVKRLYTVDDIVYLTTPHGWHIVTPPFNRNPKAFEEYFGFPLNPDWIKPDAMALLYAPATVR